MQLTKLTDSCGRVDTGAGALIDLGVLPEAAQASDGARAGRVAGQYGSAFVHLESGESREL